MTWVSLARDGYTEELAAAGLENGLYGCEDWWDTAQAIQSLDLIITVDTAIAHLGGMCGKLTWLLIAAVPDMRWLLHREDTPWYQSVRLYRQRRSGEWTEVIQRVAADLQAEVHARRVAA